MKIEPIIYNTTRGIYSVEDKLSIATIFLFCYKLGGKSISELLYTDDYEAFIDGLNEEYSDYGVDFSINFSDKNIRSAFEKTREKVIEKYDSNGFYKALFEGDKFAIVIDEIVNYDFSEVEIKKFKEKVSEQLSFKLYKNGDVWA